MDYEKIGKFIAERRKKINMTQKDLAEQLGLTDRAISRWERGIGCPDISIIENLSEILQVSVLEILHGEEIKQGENENHIIVDMLDNCVQKTKVWKKFCFVLLNTLLAIFFFFLIVTYCFSNAINKNSSLFMILSPSMKPALNVYDIVKVKKVDMNSIQFGDIITFVSASSVSNGMTLTHRVVEKSVDPATGEIFLKTKGDNNITNDEGNVYNNNLVGVVTKRYPQLGRFVLNSPFSLFLILLGSSVILLLDFVQIRNFKRK